MDRALSGSRRTKRESWGIKGQIYRVAVLLTELRNAKEVKLPSSEQAVVNAEDEITLGIVTSKEQSRSPPINLQCTGNAGNLDHARRHVNERQIVRTKALTSTGVDVEE